MSVLHLSVHGPSNFAAQMRRQVPRAYALIPARRRTLSELSIALVGDRTMASLHRRFLGIDGPTDVLTFALEADPRKRVTAGEIVICTGEGRRRAMELGHRLIDELLLYAVHGMLHLAGFDDKIASQFRVMHRMEDDILTQLGIGPVFDPQKSAPRPARSISRAASIGIP